MNEVCSIDCFLWILSVGAIWGATNPLMRLGSISSNRTNSDSSDSSGFYLIRYFKQLVFTFSNWRFSLPFIMNQAASVFFNFLVAQYPLSIVVPVTNAVQFVSTAAVGWQLGEKVSGTKATLGMLLTLTGIVMMIVADSVEVSQTNL